MSRKVDVEEFATRVERLCDFFLSKISEESARNGSVDVKVLEDLKEDAANLQFNQGQQVAGALDGLGNYMKGT